MNKPELILPAGTLDMLKASVLNGADAIYFGSKKFNARLPAKNFDDEEMRKGIDFAHFYGKKAYLTINTLIKDTELKEAILLAKNAYCLGVDAIIVQDLGLIKTLRELLPDLVIHASTQTTIHNVQGAELMADLGVKKIVLARELSIPEIKEIKKAMLKRGVEIECFIHGALCFSVSGQCQFSSFAFNKSGNRGECLQPCRLAYNLYEKGEERKIGSEKFVLSMKDLNSLHQMKELIEAGIDSFKVEGRLKGISYVATIAQAYRKSIDDVFVASEKEKKLSENDDKFVKIAFSREPTKGYFFEEKEMTYPKTPAHKGVLTAKVVGFNQGMLKLELFEPIYQWDRLAIINVTHHEEFQIKRMSVGGKEVQRAFPGQFVFIETGKRPFVEMGRELFMVTSRTMSDIAFASLTHTEQLKYDIKVYAVSEKELSAVVEVGGKKIRINSGFTLAPSKTAQTTPELIKEKVFKSSEFFSPGEFSCEIKGNPFIPLSKLKDFKAIILAKVEEEFFGDNRNEIDESKFLDTLNALLEIKKEETPSEQIKFVAFVEEKTPVGVTSEIAKSPEFAQIIYYYSNKEGISNMKSAFVGKEFYVKSPNIQFTKQLEEFSTATEGENIVCSNLGALKIAIEKKKHDKKFKFIADRELNTFNSLTEKLLLEWGAEKVVPSVECSFSQINQMSPAEKLLPLVYFYPLLMTSRAYSKDPKIKAGEYALIDRKGFEYKALFDSEKILRLYNPVPVEMLFELGRFSKFASVGLDFCAMDEKQAFQAIIFALDRIKGRAGKKKFASFTRGHYDKELE